MRAKISTLLLILCIGLFTSCSFQLKPSKKIITRQYNVTNFSAIKLEMIGNVEFTQSAKCGVEIKGPENYVKLFKVTVENGTLCISNMKNMHLGSDNTKMLKITISAPSLTNIRSKGVGNINIGKLNVQNLEVINNGVGDINIDSISGSSLSINSLGVGNINIKGTVHVASLTCSGVGDINADKLQAKVVDANCRGVGSITCFAIDSMTAAVKGVGSIKYKGKPGFKDISSSEVGSVKEY